MFCRADPNEIHLASVAMILVVKNFLTRDVSVVLNIVDLGFLKGV